MDDFDLYAPFYDLDYGDRTEDVWMYRQFAKRCGSPILELACGTGRVLLPLARKGYRVTGVDISPAMLDVARRRVEAAGLGERVTLVEQDMRRLDLPERFNLVLIAANSFAHLPTQEDQLAALDRIRRHLRPEGLLVMDVVNPDPVRLMEANGQLRLEKEITDPTGGRRLLKFVARRMDWAAQTLHVTFIVDEMDDGGRVKRTVFPFAMRLVYRYELELLLRLAGFRVEAVYGSTDLDEFGGDSPQMIAVARPDG